MNSIRVLHICPLPLFSGLEQYAFKIACEQRKRGIEVGFVALKGSELERQGRDSGLTVFTVDFAWSKSVVKAAFQYREILLGLTSLQVIHLHSSQDIDRLGLAIQLARLSGWKPKVKVKVIQQNHVWISHSKKDPLHWFTHKVLDEVWCSSQRAQEDIERYLPIAKRKIHIVRYGRDLGITNSFATRQDARTELGLPQDAVVLGAIARIDKAKGIWELINAALSLIDKGLDFYLVIIGGPTSSDPASIAFAKEVDDLVARLKPRERERIRLTGNIPNAGRLLAAFDLYAQVAYKETFSLALLDAQLAGLPVIGTDSGGTPEVVIPGKTGWLAAPEDIESLAKAVATALSEQASWKKYGEVARARVQQDFDIDVIVPEILSRYELSQSESTEERP